MQQKVVLYVSMHTPKSRSKAMKMAVGISGVISVELCGEDQRHIEVKGEGIDIATLATLLRKKFGHADLVSVGPIAEGAGGGEGNEGNDDGVNGGHIAESAGGGDSTDGGTMGNDDGGNGGGDNGRELMTVPLVDGVCPCYPYYEDDGIVGILLPYYYAVPIEEEINPGCSLM